VERDDQAAKITALLEALGYEVVRDLDHGTAQNRLRWAVTRLSSKAQLTEREADILALVLQGRSNGEIGKELEISKATVKWHMHNIFTKTGTVTREGLLREALQLGGAVRRSLPPVDPEPASPPDESDDDLEADDDE
jgi:DNA-binding CsgD family transcriptional regulator